jgi:hypothetical protein
MELPDRKLQKLKGVGISAVKVVHCDDEGLHPCRVLQKARYAIEQAKPDHLRFLVSE